MLVQIDGDGDRQDDDDDEDEDDDDIPGKVPSLLWKLSTSIECILYLQMS